MGPQMFLTQTCNQFSCPWRLFWAWTPRCNSVGFSDRFSWNCWTKIASNFKAVLIVNFKQCLNPQLIGNPWTWSESWCFIQVSPPKKNKVFWAATFQTGTFEVLAKHGPLAYLRGCFRATRADWVLCGSPMGRKNKVSTMWEISKYVLSTSIIDITQNSDSWLGSIETNLQCTILCSWPGPPHKRQKRDVPGSALAHELLYDVARGEPWLCSKVDH